MLAKIRVIKFHAWGHKTIVAEVKLEFLPKHATALHSYLSQQFLWVFHGVASLHKEGLLRQSLPHFCVLNLPCSCSSAYLCKKVKLEKLGGRRNLTLMPVVLSLLAGICLSLTYVMGFSSSLWRHVYIEVVSAKLLRLWCSCKGGSVSLNQLRMFSPPYILDSALYPGSVEKECVPENLEV